MVLSLLSAYRYIWWNIAVYLCDIGGRLNQSVDWCRIHGQWRGHEPKIIRDFFWHKP